MNKADKWEIADNQLNQSATMRAVVLEDVGKLNIREIPRPQPKAKDLLLKVGAVGICGTDLHIFQGHCNYNFDQTGRPIPLTEQPQILGHEICGTVIDLGGEVEDFRAGDRVLVDQGINCYSAGRAPCEYCLSGASHQCENYQEHGITGLQGAMAEYIAVPANNAIKLPEDLPFEQAVVSEPLACILHAGDMLERAATRYRFDGPNPIRYLLICGAGPAGLLFLQYFKNVKKFEGPIFVSDFKPRRLELAAALGAVTIDLNKQSLQQAIHELTDGYRLNLLVEASGSGALFEDIPRVLRRQGTVLLYGHGQKGKELNVLNASQFIEAYLVVSTGASGGFDQQHHPIIYRRAMELIYNGTVAAQPIVTHIYRSFEHLQQAFAKDFQEPDYIKGVFTVGQS